MNKIRCTKCNTELISKSVHDFQQCACDNGTFCDGGNDYQRIGGKEWKYIETWLDGKQEWLNMVKLHEEQDQAQKERELKDALQDMAEFEEKSRESKKELDILEIAQEALEGKYGELPKEMISVAEWVVKREKKK